jgi:phosphohistidine phosphatase
MQQIVLLRHAKAEPAGRDGEDSTRPLSSVGRQQAPRIASALLAAGADPEIALVSDARRTRETWSLVSPVFPRSPAHILGSLYLCTPETLMQEALGSGRDRVMLVGHNPGIHELACQLVEGDGPLERSLREKFPTCAAAVFTRHGGAPRWTLDAYLTPALIP